VRRALQVLAAIAALGLAVLYGFFAHSHHWFPYGALHAVHRAFGLGVQNARRWDRPPEGASKLSQREAVNTLLSVPYLRGYDPATGKEGVTVDDAGQAYPGWNICVSAHAPEARLIDMEGTLRHRWSLDVSKVWPARKEDPDFRDYDKFWRRVLLLPDGGLLVIWEYIGIMRIDRDSRLLWANACGAHHDVAVDGAGRIFVLTRQKKILPDVNPDVPVFEDFVTELAPDGRLVKSISLLRAFERSDYAAELAAMKNAGDLFHSNALQILDGSLASRRSAGATSSFRSALSVSQPSWIRTAERSSGPCRDSGGRSTPRGSFPTGACSSSTTSERCGSASRVCSRSTPSRSKSPGGTARVRAKASSRRRTDSSRGCRTGTP
jgi:hypothetical protein